MLAISSVKAEVEEDEGVLVLTDSNFDEVLAKHDFLLVEFYAPWCGHCKSLAPEYVKAAKVLKENSPSYSIAKVDVTANEKLGERFKIQGFPTLKFFRKGVDSEYNGGRTEPDISNWVLKKVGPPSTEVTTDTLKEKLQTAKLALVYFGDVAASEYKDTFLQLAEGKLSEKFNFYHSSDMDVAASHNVKDLPAFVLFRKFDESPLTFTGDISVDKIVEWATKSSIPTVVEFSEEYIEPIFGEKQHAIILFRDAADESSDFAQVFNKAGTELKGEIIFVTSGVSEGIQARLAEFIGVTADQLPTIRILKPSENMKKFAYSEDVKGLSIEKVKQFVSDFKADKLTPFLKSEEIPATNDEPVKVIVGKNFKDIVLDDSKDVLLEVYAPWCGHCKQLAPVFDELAADLKDVSNLVIAKLDGTANEIEGLEVQGFPTLKFYPAGSKGSPVDYTADRGIDDFKNWLKENSKIYGKFLESGSSGSPKVEEGAAKTEEL